MVVDLEAVVDLYDSIWKRDEGPLLTAQLLRAFAKAGNYVVGAFDGPTLIGACVGFFAAPADGALHSHIAGVSATARRRHVGLAIKLHQRAWALHRGASTIGWTFDPLVARNAWFNLGRLGAVPVEYLTDFYGGMHDGINGPDSSDRLLVHWDLTRPSPAAVDRSAPGRAERYDHADAALGVSESGAPVPGPTRTPILLVAVPPDVESLRVTHPHLASQWRSELRASLGGLLAAGARIEGFDRRGWYVVRQDPPRPAAERAEEGVG
ncbi:GNAT family N-acetyltransferase [Allobranchiibius sp. GilTou38]|nr:GNAT family N-acetyltransferase [Allobranchiibius sp. GilTou38]